MVLPKNIILDSAIGGYNLPKNQDLFVSKIDIGKVTEQDDLNLKTYNKDSPYLGSIRIVLAVTIGSRLSSTSFISPRYPWH